MRKTAFFLVCFIFVSSTAISNVLESSKRVLTLSEVSQLAVQNNLSIQIAAYDARIAKTNKDESRSLYDAYLTAHASYRDDQTAKSSTIFGSKNVENNYNFGYTQKLPSGTQVAVDVLNNRSFTNSAFATSTVTHESSVQLSLTQDLGKNFFGLADRSSVKLVDLESAINEFMSIEDIEMELAQVQQAYWALVLADKRVAIQQNMVDQAKILFDSQQEKIKTGLTEKPELIAAQANYENQRRLLFMAEDQRDAQKAVLKLLLNIDNNEVSIEPKERFQLFNENENMDAAIQSAFEHRRDYKRLRKQIEAAGLTLVIANNNLWPEIDLVGSVKQNAIDDHFNQSLEKISDEDNPEYYVGLDIRMPIMNTQAKAQQQRADLQKARALLALKLMERRMTVNVSNQVRRVNVLNKSAAQAKLVADLQAQKLKEEEKRFQRGRSNLDTIIRYQKDALEAEILAAEALYEHHIALVELRRQEGVLLDQYWNGS